MNQEYKVHLSQGQKAKLAKAIKDGSALKLRLGKNALSGNDELLLSPRQIAKLQKAKRNNSGVEISFSKSSIRKSVKHGGSLWTSLFSLGTKALPFVTKGVSKVAPHLATGALSALGSLGKGLQVSKKTGVGVGQGLQVSQKPFLWQPPPFYGTWRGEGRGKKGKGLLLGDNSPFNHIPILGAIL